MTSSPQTRALRINMVELLRHPGSERSIEHEISAEDLGCQLAPGQSEIAGNVVVEVTAVAATDDVAVSGLVAIPWSGECRRCLKAISGVRNVDFDERFAPARDRDRLSSVDGDPSLVEGDQIDLVEPIRETVMIETPTSVLCSDDCKGICDVCGVDRNEASCECVVAVRDERWAALDDLQLDD